MRSVAVALLLLALVAGARPLQAGPAVAPGLVDAPGAGAVSRHCTGCHSTRLIVQHRATRAGWAAILRWMQEKQGLWPLGADRDPILDYLAGHYAPGDRGRRAPLPPSLRPAARAALR